jgi:hypothetical protein
MNAFCQFAVQSFPWIVGAILLGGCDPSKEAKEAKEETPRSRASVELPPTKGIPPSPQATANAPSTRVDTEPSCAAICEKAKTRGCTSELSICMAKCRDMTLEPECRSELGQALNCLAGLSTADWQCGDEGFPEVLPGRCEREQQVVVQCLTAALK